MRPAIEKYMNFNKRGVQAIGSSEAVGRYYSAQRGERERDGEEDKGKAEGKNSQCNCNPSPQLLTTTVINYNSSLATAVIAN